MKFFTLIFSFYLLGLSCFPCGDNIECGTKSETTINKTTNHENHNHENENCSPLCSCSCCASAINFVTAPFYRFEKKVFQTKKYSTYDVSYNSQVSFSIWQPPKLS